MFLKIKLRTQLLNLISAVGLPSNPYKLNPICNYLYYDFFNLWLPTIKSQTKGSSVNEILEHYLDLAIDGLSPESIKNIDDLQKQNPDSSYSINDAIDDEVLETVKRLDPDFEVLYALKGALRTINY